MQENQVRKNLIDRNRAEIESYLGSPKKVNYLDNNLVELCYDSPFMTLYLIKDDSNLVFQSMHLDEIEYDCFRIKVGVTQRDELIKELRETHKNKKLQYIYSVEEYEDEMIMFPNIDLIVWLENNIVSDISIETML